VRGSEREWGVVRGTEVQWGVVRGRSWWSIVLYCIVICGPVLYYSTLPPGINSFAVNNNNNNNNNFLCPILSKSDTRQAKLYLRPQLQPLFHSVHFHHSDSWPTVLCRYFPVPNFIHIGQEMCDTLQYGTKPVFPELCLTWRRFPQDSCTHFCETLTKLTVVTNRWPDGVVCA
jgi:hypothetical protein